jgi:hypothetical protein
MLHPSRQPGKADDAQLACAARNAQGDMLLSPIGTEGKAFRFTYRLL